MKKQFSVLHLPVYVWLLLAGLGLFVLSNGRWIVPIATWLAPFFLLGFCRSLPPFKGLLLLFLCITMASRIMLYGIIPSSIGALTYILTVYYALLWFFPYLVDRLISHRMDSFVSTLLFPAAGVMAEYINNLLFGSWAATAYTQFDILPLLQLSSITGMWGISFLVLWFGPVFLWYLDRRMETRKAFFGPYIYLAILAIVLLYGGLRLATSPPASKTVAVSSFTATDQINSYFATVLDKGYRSTIDMASKDRNSLKNLLNGLYDEVFESNSELLGDNVKMSLWAEGMIQVLEEEEAQFIERGARLANEKNVYLLMAYLLVPSKNPAIQAENKSVFISPDGQVVWEYLKAYPVPGSTDRAGDGQIPAHHTAFATVGNAICYDMDFTRLIHQAGRKAIDIMLVPAWDWEAIDPLHSRMAVFRAIENGFSMVRQTGNGLSIAVDYQGRTLASMDQFTSDETWMVAHIPKKGVWTLYSLTGDLFAWLCALGLLLAFFRITLRSRTS